ncbi:hypothetical protein [Actinoplanes sp. ATCC 53533]|uniref:hypothetical protein n=1 Tax=Actinoplanes sp. ATCC 53533 TaxID=1288362 RepID=UPI001315474F|nr:hypothetical protein [Actinoplanes sp. ATCC 53533]
MKTSPSSSRTRIANVGFLNAALATTAVCTSTSGNGRGRIDTATHLTQDTNHQRRPTLTGQNNHVTDHNQRAAN